MGRKELIVAGRVALFLIFAVILQTVLISHLRILGVTADLFLIPTQPSGYALRGLGDLLETLHDHRGREPGVAPSIDLWLRRRPDS